MQDHGLGHPRDHDRQCIVTMPIGIADCGFPSPGSCRPAAADKEHFTNATGLRLPPSTISGVSRIAQWHFPARSTACASGRAMNFSPAPMPVEACGRTNFVISIRKQEALPEDPIQTKN